MAHPAEIIKSAISVYEIELNLRDWKVINTNQVPSFHQSLFKTIPSLKDHKCMSGKAGGFSIEVQKGTSFAHVIEHVLLELIHLSDSGKQSYTGWTREQDKNQTYIIHYSAPNFLTGRLAAILGVDLIKRLIQGEEVNIDRYIELLKEPLQYFTREEYTGKKGEPFSVIQELSETPPPPVSPSTEAKLSEKQISNIRNILRQIRKHQRTLVESWRTSFFEYSGNFGKMIVDKIELLNLFLDWLIEGKLDIFFRGVRRTGQLIGSYRIPINFVIYSIWLFKNKLLTYLIEEYGEDKVFLDQAVKDFDDFFQIYLQNVTQGYFEQTSFKDFGQIGELKEFRELKERKGNILVVDDDEMVRSACRDILEYLGYWVILASGGNEALEILSKKKEHISLVILDLSLPDIGGKEMYYKIKESSPTTKVLLTTGYSIIPKFREVLAKHSIELINKPFTAEALGDKVESLLEAPK